MIAERWKHNRQAFVVRPPDQERGGWLLSFRDVQALVAVRQGLAHARLKRRYAMWCADEYLEPECDVYGIGAGTLWHLQNEHGGALVQRPEAEGPMALTDLGEQVVDALLALPGLTVAGIVPSDRVAAAADHVRRAAEVA